MQVEAYLPLVAWLPAALWLTHRAARRRSWRTALAAGMPLAAMALGGRAGAPSRSASSARTEAHAIVPPPDRLTVDRLRRLDWPRICSRCSSRRRRRGRRRDPPAHPEAGERGRARHRLVLGVRVAAHDLGGAVRDVFSAGRPDVLTLASKASTWGSSRSLAFVGFALRRPGAALGRWLAAGTFLVAMGAPVLSWVVFRLVPGMSRLSTTGYLLWLFDFGLVLLAAVALDGLLALARAWREVARPGAR